jgi:hypothetical protein
LISVRTGQRALRSIWALALLAAVWTHDASADKKTICTITVNSSDEKEEFQRSLPADGFRFVELVEQGRPDWLKSACEQDIRCDALVISGHYDGRDEFYSDRVSAKGFLPVEEMERASCSPSCSGLFSQLKEVYLFGCNTLNPEALKRASAEIERSLVRSGYSRADAERLARALNLRHGESSRDRMRLIFNGVPVIYGFSAKAPVGPVAASMLSGYFRSNGGSETGSGRPSARLLSYFRSSSLTVARGLSDSDALANFRHDICQFADDELLPAQKIRFVHRLMSRDMAEVRLYLDRIEKYVASVSDAERETPDVSQALDEIAADKDARSRYLDFARDADQPVVRTRMIKLASRLGWLSPDDERAEFVRLINETLERDAVSPADVDLVCVLNEDGGLEKEFNSLRPLSAPNLTVGQAAILACLGNVAARAEVIRALTSFDAEEAQVAQAYLRRRTITDADELRELTSRIAGMIDSAAQVRALAALEGQRLSDPESLETLARLFAIAQSADVQAAIADILIRSDFQSIATLELAQTLRDSSLRSTGRSGSIEILLRRLQGG